MPECSDPTCLSLHLLGGVGGGGGAAASKFNICICLTTSQPLDEKQRLCGKMKEHGSEECRIRPDSAGRPHSTSLKHS